MDEEVTPCMSDKTTTPSPSNPQEVTKVQPDMADWQPKSRFNYEERVLAILSSKGFLSGTLYCSSGIYVILAKDAEKIITKSSQIHQKKDKKFRLFLQRWCLKYFIDF